MRISDWSSDVCSSDLRFGRSVVPHDLAVVQANTVACGWRCLVGEDLADLPHEPVVPEEDAHFRVQRYRARVEVHRPDEAGAISSEEGRVGREGVSKCRTRWLPYP